MNPIEKDLRSYFGITSESNILEHYGTKRHSGRYPWGSGDNPYQHSGDFLSRIDVLKKKGLSEKDILESINDSLPKEYQMSLSEFRVAKRTAIHERKTSEYEQIHKLKDEDHLGWTEIANQLGMSESSVRSKYAGNADKKAQRAKNIAETLKKEVDKKGMIDVSEGANFALGVTDTELQDAVYTLEAEYGYKRYGVGIKQPTNNRQQTNIMVLAKPEFDQKYAYNHQEQIDSLGDYHTDDGGDTFTSLKKGSKATLKTIQDKESGFVKQLYIQKAAESDHSEFESQLQKAIKQLQATYPFLSVKKINEGLYLIDIPQACRSGHEAHFSKVAKTFLHYLQYKDMPEWENENTISKYYITTTAVEMAKSRDK